MATAADTIVNYPLWMYAKRSSAGLCGPTSPYLLYKGCFSIWLSTGPTIIAEEAISRTVAELSDGASSNSLSKLGAGVLAGATAAVLITSPVEDIVTKAHARGTSVLSILQTKIRSRNGLISLCLPHGALACAGREVPFATSLFCVQPAVSKWMSTGKKPQLQHELSGAVVAAAVGCPLGQAPAVVMAYQQANDVNFKTAFDILSRQGTRRLFRGVIARTVSCASTMAIVPIVSKLLNFELQEERHNVRPCV